MYERLVTRSGDVIWLRQPVQILGRYEIARIEFANWERRKRREGYKRGVEL